METQARMLSVSGRGDRAARQYSFSVIGTASDISELGASNSNGGFRVASPVACARYRAVIETGHPAAEPRSRFR
ncbi:hypothetical protein C481_00530 [Natrialba asiatica DSM 12278]|uniref:Uncharacterized protein n=1 Tax=Natrialba asiatica (strain ATCC 700177 / DSM 12278 / JCM 9576 / FERM P-10747 / NBRC 102637 / 172P1) TaxID=29540 RepID=M0B8K4_NATA1|nr:hypothetical protein C481_00530 [Natrialba asiatica DSM 12278]